MLRYVFEVNQDFKPNLREITQIKKKLNLLWLEKRK